MMIDDTILGKVKVLEDLVRCAQREIQMRERVYPERVKRGKMKLAASTNEIIRMKRILRILEIQLDKAKGKSKDLFSGRPGYRVSVEIEGVDGLDQVLFGRTYNDEGFEDGKITVYLYEGDSYMPKLDEDGVQERILVDIDDLRFEAVLER